MRCWGTGNRSRSQGQIGRNGIKDSALVLIVRREAGDRRFLQDLLRRHGIRSAQAATGAEAAEAVRRERPAVTVLDVELEDVTGYELCRQLRDEHGETLSIIFVSADRTEALDRIAGLLIGADDYVVEPFDPDELVARVRRSLARSATAAGSPPEDARSPLTRRERDVLGMLAAGLAQPDIAEALVISPKTVATHIQRILIKLDVHSRAQAVAVAYRDGLIPEAGTSPASR